MNEALKRKLSSLIQEEQKTEVDLQFLERLHELAAGGSCGQVGFPPLHA